MKKELEVVKRYAVWQNFIEDHISETSKQEVYLNCGCSGCGGCETRCAPEIELWMAERT